jgi:hypothetical protein
MSLPQNQPQVAFPFFETEEKKLQTQELQITEKTDSDREWYEKIKSGSVCSFPCDKRNLPASS